MALVLKDRVKESSSSSGTGSITLGGAIVGYQTFASAVASGSTVYYTIHNLSATYDTEWEVGVGTFTSPSTLSRDTVFSSSTGSKVNFTSGSGGLEVFITQPAEQALYTNQATGSVEAFGNGSNTIAFTNINASNIVTVSGTISTNAANATDITNKQYVDGLFSTGISYHEPVLVEEDTALNAVYVQPNGAGNGVGATLTNNGSNAALVVDGVSVANTARILVYAQANAVQNGVYTVTNPGNATAQWVLTRATDADTFGLASPNKLGQGDAFFVQDGNTGAGRTYICNTSGTITFGSTNITFAQISSAQIYDAGTGLNLSNLTFSIANTAVTAAQYGNDGAVGQFTVNAQGQITNAANVSINASSISVGTLANARTTADSANGASTIVLRDANGSFNANVITATTVNATTGNFTNITANASGLTDINASNISSGTISNARTTASDANSASTIVLRDANGAFTSGNITASNFIGAGTTITSINASNISSGTIANARTTASSSNSASTIVLRDSNGDFAADAITANFFIGDGSNVSAINGSNVTTGTIANARTTASSSNGASTIVLRDAGGAFAAGAITGTSFTGNGSALTAINASSISSGTLDNARTNATSANGASTLVVRDANGSFAGNVITGTTGTFTNISGNASSLTAINASNISSGTIDNARTTAATANGASTIVLRDSSGAFAAGVITANGSALSDINASSITTGTIDNARTTASSSNGANTIVVRDASGDFSVDGITANWFTGNGANLSAINASNISSGTIANARTTGTDAATGSTLVLRDANGSFSGNVITATNLSGGGTSITSINASNLSAGTVASARISGSYTGITGVGTITAGTWQGNSITTTYTDAKVTSVSAGTGISVNATTGAITVTNGGVTSAVAGTGVTVSGATGAVTFSIAQAVGTGSSVQFGSFGVGTAASGTTGEIRATNNITAYYSSDERLKDNVQVITDALLKLGQIRGVEFDWNNLQEPEDGYFVRKHDIGVIAQEVEKILPEVVAIREDGIKAVKYDRLIPLLIEAIKELKAEVDQLKKG
jgi:trimeric autotransporter adhesin